MTLRYLVLTELLLPTKGGTAVWFDEVYRRLGDRTTHIITRAVPGSDDHDRDHPNSIHRIKMDDAKRLIPATLPKYIALFLKSLQLSIRYRFDAIHAGRVLPEGLVGLVVARLTRKPCVIYAHGEEITTWSVYPRRKRAMRFAFCNADLVIANSDFTRRQLIELGVSGDRILIIYPGVDAERFFPTEDHDDLRAMVGATARTKIILSVGRLSRRKGFDRTIEALSRLKKNDRLDFRYVVIGIGEERENLEQLADELGIHNNVHFLGHVTPDDLPRWYNTCDVFIMPNREINGDTEGFGMVFIEAAACGKPVIAGNAGGTGDAVLNGETGFRIDGNDVNEISKTLLRLLNDEELSHTMGSAAAARAKNCLSWENVASRTRAIHD